MPYRIIHIYYYDSVVEIEISINKQNVNKECKWRIYRLIHIYFIGNYLIWKPTII